MNTEQQIGTVELSLTEAKKIASLGEAIKRLESNKDFKRLIFDEYFTKEAQRLVFLTTNPSLESTSQAAVWTDIQSISSFRQFLVTRKTMAEMAKKEIKDYTETLDELRAEDADTSDEG